MAQYWLLIVQALVAGLKRRMPMRRRQDETSGGLAARAARLRTSTTGRLKMDSAELIRQDRDER